MGQSRICRVIVPCRLKKIYHFVRFTKHHIQGFVIEICFKTVSYFNEIDLSLVTMMTRRLFTSPCFQPLASIGCHEFPHELLQIMKIEYREPFWLRYLNDDGVDMKLFLMIDKRIIVTKAWISRINGFQTHWNDVTSYSSFEKKKAWWDYRGAWSIFIHIVEHRNIF